MRQRRARSRTGGKKYGKSWEFSRAPCDSVTATNLSRDSERPHKADIDTCDKQIRLRSCIERHAPLALCCATCSNFSPRSYALRLGYEVANKFRVLEFRRTWKFRQQPARVHKHARDLTQQWPIFIQMWREYYALTPAGISAHNSKYFYTFYANLIQS